MKNPQYAAFLTFLALFFLPLISEAQDKRVDWISIEEAEARSLENPKKIFVDVYTDWCSWCKRMDRETFSHPAIIDYVNTHYYAVKLNAEQTKPIVFKGVTYENENPGGRRSAHNFAIAVLAGRMSYPSVAFFDEELQLITTLPGFRPPDTMKPVLVFFNEEIYKKSQDLEGFISSYKGKK
jgi:thioredoxin-related protein